MGILTKDEIIHRIRNYDLIIDAHQDNGAYAVEPASYDLRAGILIWKENDNDRKKSIIKRMDFDPLKPCEQQEMVTIHPGQVMFVITKEQIKMPLDLCGTVYAKNEFSRAGILLFTTGHIDPGIQCPIVIRLINLRSTPYALMLGHPIYTIVFHQIAPFAGGNPTGHENISMEKTIKRTITSAEDALDNALYDLSLINNLVRKDEFETLANNSAFIKEQDFGKVGWRWIKKNFIKAFFLLVGILVFVATIISAIPSAIETWQKWKNPKDTTIVQPQKSVVPEESPLPIDSNKTK